MSRLVALPRLISRSRLTPLRRLALRALPGGDHALAALTHLRGDFARHIRSRHLLCGLAHRLRGLLQSLLSLLRIAVARGFSGLTEGNEAGDVVEMLNAYFAILTDAAYQHDGTIFNMSGDSMLVGFNVPFLQSDAATRALRAAQDMVSRFAPVSAQWERRCGVRTGVGIGICMGEGIIGNVGSPHYMNYTVIGDPVDTAARLMQVAGANEILICGRVYEAVRDLLPAGTIAPRGDISLRGKTESVPVFSVRT